jgi:hypothetical protein
MSKAVFTLIAGALVAAALQISTVPASAHFVPSPCDFITGGGFIFSNEGERVNFGIHGGCKNGEFWGHLNFVHHSRLIGPYHVKSTEITGYLFDPAFPNARDICGIATTSLGETVRFRVRLEDNGEPGRNDRLGIRMSNGYHLTTRSLGADGPGGGNIQLHKPNRSTFGPDPAPDEGTMCPFLATP